MEPEDLDHVCAACKPQCPFLWGMCCLGSFNTQRTPSAASRPRGLSEVLTDRAVADSAGMLFVTRLEAERGEDDDV